MSTLVLDTITGKSTSTTVTIGSTPVVSASANSMTIRGEGSAQTSIQQGLLKCWVEFDGTASGAAARDSFNLTSMTDNSTGNYTVTIANDMASANYLNISGSNALHSVGNNSNKTASVCQFTVHGADHGGADANRVSVGIAGDLA